MGIGHVAVGLGLKRADPGVNTGWLIFAALLPDFLLGWFALAGKETYEVPPDFATGHYLLFTFPWSHGLAADLVWATIAGFLMWRFSGRRAGAVAIALAVLSHFLLDGIAHVKGLPVFGANGPAFGLALWRNLPLELGLEILMTIAGLWIYRSVARRSGMLIYVAILAVFLVAGQTAGSQVPGRGALIASWLIVTPAIAAIAYWLDR